MPKSSWAKRCCLRCSGTLALCVIYPHSVCHERGMPLSSSGALHAGKPTPCRILYPNPSCIQGPPHWNETSPHLSGLGYIHHLRNAKGKWNQTLVLRAGHGTSLNLTALWHSVSLVLIFLTSFLSSQSVHTLEAH